MSCRYMNGSVARVEPAAHLVQPQSHRSVVIVVTGPYYQNHSFLFERFRSFRGLGATRFAGFFDPEVCLAKRGWVGR
jgi:hypothetical protein